MKQEKKILLYLEISDFPTSKTHQWDTNLNYDAKLSRSSTGQSSGVFKTSSIRVLKLQW